MAYISTKPSADVIPVSLRLWVSIIWKEKETFLEQHVKIKAGIYERRNGERKEGGIRKKRW